MKDAINLLSSSMTVPGLEPAARQIAILVLDTPIPGVAEVHGDFGDNAIELITNSIATSGDTVPVNKNHPLVKYQLAFDSDPSEYLPGLLGTYRFLKENIANGTIKGIYLTGSRSDPYSTDIPWITELDNFIKSFLLKLSNFPVVGICFGHQILLKNLGSKVGVNDLGWELGTTTINLNKDIMTVENTPFKGSLPEGKEIHLNILESHRDIAYDLPPSTGQSLSTEFICIGSTPKCAIQGIMTKSGPVKLLTFQGHPEFPPSIVLKFLQQKYKDGSIDKQTFEKCTYKTKNLQNHGQLLGKVINNFYHTYAD